MHFGLALRSVTLDNLELLWFWIFGEFRGISQIWEATTAKQNKDRPVFYVSSCTCKCNPLNVQHHVLCIYLQIFFARGFQSYMHCCRALTLALPRLSCWDCYGTATFFHTIVFVLILSPPRPSLRWLLHDQRPRRDHHRPRDIFHHPKRFFVSSWYGLPLD